MRCVYNYGGFRLVYLMEDMCVHIDRDLLGDLNVDMDIDTGIETKT